MKKFKQFFQEKIILSAVMCVLLAVVLVTATYGWYAISNSAKMYGLDLKTGGTGGIKVAIEPGGEDIMSDDSLQKIEEDGKVIAIIPIKLTDFINIEEGKIAPGAYGPMPFYITALSESVKSYSIKVHMEYEPSGEAAISEDQKQEIEAMINDHIIVYQTKYEENGIVKFKDPLDFYENESDDVETATGALTYNVEVPAILYWVWNYEVIDVPNYTCIERFSGMDEKSAIRKYDEEDTILGNYIEDIYFNVYIEGRMEGEND